MWKIVSTQTRWVVKPMFFWLSNGLIRPKCKAPQTLVGDILPLQNQWAVTSHAVYLNAKKPWAKKYHIWQMGIIPILQRIITRQTLGTSCWDAHCKFALRAMRWPCCYRVRTARLLWTFQTWTMSGPRQPFFLTSVLQDILLHVWNQQIAFCDYFLYSSASIIPTRKYSSCPSSY